MADDSVDSPSAYRALLENTHTAMFIIDPADGRIVDANPKATVFYGWPRETLRRREISEITIRTVGRGSTFTVWLPIRQPQDPA